jgi:vanillate O-demethylase monooxygenase subunit
MTMPFLRNSWYIAGWPEEVTRQPTCRILLGEEVLFYRTAEGEPVALSNRCPHRFVELHKGVLEGDNIRCPYHGLRFGPSGSCTLNPHGDGRTPGRATLKRYPLVERHKLLWLWMGDPGAADALLIPDFSPFDELDRYALVKGRLSVAADYQLLADNLMDLSHVEFLHPQFRATDAAARTTFDLTKQGNTVYATWRQTDEPMEGLSGELWVARGGKVGELATVSRTMRWDAPSNFLLSIESRRPDVANDEAAVLIAYHLLTPETVNSTHYLWGILRNGALNDASFDERLRVGSEYGFVEQDFPMIESQQRYLKDVDLMSMNPVVLAGDAGSIRMRRILKNLIRTERRSDEARALARQTASNSS